MRRVGVVGIAVALVAGAAGACSSGDDDGGGGGLGGPGGDLAGQLEALPLPADGDDDDLVTVAFGDLARAAELAGIDLPAAGDDGQDAQIEALNTVTGVLFDPEEDQHLVGALPPNAAHVQRMADVDEFVAEVGWNVFEVQQFVELQMPPEDVTVLRGDFDEDLLAEAMGEPDDGVWVVGNPEGNDLRDSSVARPVGEALWLSLDDDRLIVAKTEEGMAAARGETDRPTVGDDRTLSDLADAFDGLGAYSGVLLRGNLSGLGAAGRLTSEQVEVACEDSLPGPFAGVGVGITDDDGPVFVIAYATPDDDAAAATAEAVERMVNEGSSVVSREPWSERLTVDEVSTDGNVAVARLRPAEPGPAAFWFRLAMQRDNLITYC